MSYHEIPDDPAAIDPLFKQLKENALNSLPRLSPSFRVAQLQRLLKGLTQLEDAFAAALKEDLGLSPFYNHAFSVKMCAKELEYYIKHTQGLAKPRSVDTPLYLMAKSHVQPQPFGLVLVMGAWNYPLVTTLKPMAAAMAAGNSVLLKPSEMAPRSSNILAKLVAQWLDPRFYRVAEGQIKVCQHIIALPFDQIIFTGSPQKGRLVAQAAAQNLVPCILELGGKSPTIVDQDADMRNAALRITFGRFLNCGQTCIAPDYVFVHESLSDQLADQIAATIKDFYGQDPSLEIGKIVNEFHTVRLQSYLQEEHGGRVVTGGKVDPASRFVQPTVVLNPRPDSKMMTDQIFGPILPILTFKHIDQAIAFINKRDKPLALYYFGKGNQAHVEQRTSSGSLVVNDTLIQMPNEHLPFGGVGTSGSGFYNGPHGFDQCSHMRGVSDAWVVNSGPFMGRYPPFTADKQGKFNFLMEHLGMGQGELIRRVLKWVVLALVVLVVYRMI